MLLVICLMLAFTACGDAPKSGEGAVVELTFATSLYVEEPHQRALDALIEAYNARNPNVKITIYGADYANFWNNLTTEIISGNEADMIQITPDRLASYNALREGGAFLDLDNYMEGTNHTENLVGQNDAMIDGKPVALANYAWGTTGVFYRKSILEAAGINGESIKNSEDFVAALQATTNDDVVGMGVVVGTHTFVVNEWIRMCARSVSGGAYFPEEQGPYTADNLVVNSAENVWCAKWWQDLILNQKVMKPNSDKKDARELFWNGLAAFNMDGPWFIGMTESNDPALLDDVGLIPHPEMIYEGNSYKARPTYSPYITSISSECANPDAAWDFLNWMTSDEAQAIIATCGMTPCSRAFFETDGYKEEYPLSYKFSVFMEENYGKLMAEPATEKYAELLDAYVETGQKMFGQGADCQAEMDKLQKTMATIMNK